MSMLAGARRAFFRLDWTTRSRNLPVAGELRELGAAVGSRLLDVGSGELGVGVFAREVTLFGLDYVHPGGPIERPFVVGDVADLPFRDRAFDVVTCVDVLEHLPIERRPAAVEELLRVAGSGLVLAFPSGPAAAASDARHETRLRTVGHAVPDWLTEHRRAPLPDHEPVVADLERASASLGRRVQIKTSFSERLAVSDLVRAAATRSRILYALAAVGFGIGRRFVPAPGPTTAYRAMLTVRIED